MATEQLGFDPNDFPSLELTYKHIEGVLGEQARVSEVLSNKAALIWTAATAILGIVVTLVLNSGSVSFSDWAISLFYSAVVIYLIITLYSFIVTFPYHIGGISNPDKIWDYFATLPRERFMVDMISHIGKRYKTNRTLLEIKGDLVRTMLPALLLQMGLLVSWSAIVFND